MAGWKPAKFPYKELACDGEIEKVVVRAGNELGREMDLEKWYDDRWQRDWGLHAVITE